MIADWRATWKAGTGQTDAEFPFGFVQLNSVSNGPVYDDPPAAAEGGDPYSPSFGYGGIRWAQTAGYGFAPNPKMPAVFMATVYDTPDRPYPVPYDNGTKKDPGFNVIAPSKRPLLLGSRAPACRWPMAWKSTPWGLSHRAPNVMAVAS